MATTYDYTNAQLPARSIPYGNYTVGYTLTLASAVINDVYKLPLTVPAGAYIVGAVLDSDDVDTNASPTIVMALGDATTADSIITGSTAGQAGGITYMNKSGALGKTYTTDTNLQLKITTAAATFAAGNVRIAVILSNDFAQGV